jgi:hypothetical protein
MEMNSDFYRIVEDHSEIVFKNFHSPIGNFQKQEWKSLMLWVDQKAKNSNKFEIV